MQDFAPFTPELTGALSFPQTPGRTATALCAVGQHVSRVEGPLHVVGGYQVKKLRGPADQDGETVNTPLNRQNDTSW